MQRLARFSFLMLLLGAGSALLPAAMAADRRTSPPAEQGGFDDQFPGEEQRSRSIRGPLLSYIIVDETAVAPVLGVPGAATVGPRLAELPKTSAAVFSPERHYGLAIAAEDRRVWLARNLDGNPSAGPLECCGAGASLLAISPSGRAAAIHYQEANELWVLSDVLAPGAPWRVSTGALPGPVAAIAVGEDASHVLAAAGSDGAWTIVLLQPSGEWKYVAAAAGPVSLAFLGDQDGAVYADGAASQVFLVENLKTYPSVRLLAGAAEGVANPVAVGAGRDGRRVVIANDSPASVVTVSLDGAEASRIECGFLPSQAAPFGGNAVFRLTAADVLPIRLLDADQQAPRVVFIPPPSRTEEPTGGAQ